MVLLIAALTFSLYFIPVSFAATVLHHDLFVRIFPEQQKLVGVDKITVKNNGNPVLKLMIHEKAEINKLKIRRSVKTKARKETRGGKNISPALTARPFIDYKFREGVITIFQLDRFREEILEVQIRYEVSFKDSVPANQANADDPTYGITGIISPQGTFLLAECGWYPEQPDSTPTYLVRIETPNGIEAVTLGKLISHEVKRSSTATVWKVDHPARGLMLSAGAYIMKTRMAGGIPIYVYFTRRFQDLVDQYLDAAGRFIELYSRLIGPYPFAKFAVVENFFPTGYGFPSYTLLGSSIIRLPFILTTSLGHEIAHSWFGNCVMVDERGGNWAEGLVTYIADYLYKEKASEEEARSYRTQILRDYSTLVSPENDFPLAAFIRRYSPATRAVGYGKAAMVFHMIRERIGDAAFWRALRKVYREKHFKSASWSDFFEFFSKEGALAPKIFLEQWIERAGAPFIGLQSVTAKRDQAGWHVSGEVVQQKPYYDLQIPIRLERDGQPFNSLVTMQGGRSFFEFHTRARPQRIILDPDAHVFRRLYPQEIPPSVNSIRGSTSLIAVVSQNMPPGSTGLAEQFLRALGHSNPIILTEEDVAGVRLAEYDLFFFGLPENKSLLPPIPHRLSLYDDSFSIDGNDYRNRGDVLFVALKSNLSSEHVAAILLPLRPEGACKTIRKIPHYGKYSLLVFRNGKNLIKEIQTIKESPLVHPFPIEKDVPPLL